MENQFIASGYNPGSHKENNFLQDTLIMCKFPKGVNKSQFRGMKLTESAKPLASNVLNQLNKKKNPQMAVIRMFQ